MGEFPWERSARGWAWGGRGVVSSNGCRWLDVLGRVPIVAGDGSDVLIPHSRGRGLANRGRTLSPGQRQRRPSAYLDPLQQSQSRPQLGAGERLSGAYWWPTGRSLSREASTRCGPLPGCASVRRRDARLHSARCSVRCCAPIWRRSAAGVRTRLSCRMKVEGAVREPPADVGDAGLFAELKLSSPRLCGIGKSR